MKTNIRQTKKQLKLLVKDTPLLFNDINFVTSFHNVLLKSEQVDNFTYEKEYLNLNSTAIDSKIREDITSVLNSAYEDKKISELFIAFFTELANYLNGSAKNMEVEFELLKKYSTFAEYLKANYKKNFNDIMIFMNKKMYKKQKGFR
jgi:hypothetical protein